MNPFAKTLPFIEKWNKFFLYIIRTLEKYPIFSVIFYIILKLSVLGFFIKSYNYNLWALVGIWEGFANFNPDLIEKGSVIFKNGGYDGQFFYFITNYLTKENLPIPILDSFFLRFQRIGLSLMMFPFIKILGIQFYPLVLLLMLSIFHVLSFYILRVLCKTENKNYAFLYLFSPFSLNSDLLLVADSFLVSFLLIGLFLFYRSGFLFDEQIKKPKLLLLSILAFMFCSLIKESAFFLICPLILYAFYKKNILVGFLLSTVILFYLTFTILIKSIPNVHLGTNPLNFLQLSDFPFFGLWKSFTLPNDFKSLTREFVKIPLLAYFTSLVFLLFKIRNLENFILSLPIVFTISQVAIAEEGYWRSFDNLSRMFTLSLPYSLFLFQKLKYSSKPIIYSSIFILILLVFRMTLLKTPMDFVIY